MAVEQFADIVLAIDIDRGVFEGNHFRDVAMGLDDGACAAVAAQDKQLGNERRRKDCRRAGGAGIACGDDR
jgi:hypothetical protein